ncbi:discoidin domain-containing protein [Nocardioides sp. TF02-7]|uniref:discoidin domain-containing protein n=1 Tax=Nocardioides sp. TF02-7 TaxID=2917724 RepID=UPI001F05C06D|nr:discoidin domain-containing protein [Nocardioides sp. TF02-7]UMG92147.1 discoidin domain-containing protein [Nocardioides sp. TF02-7]
MQRNLGAAESGGYDVRDTADAVTVASAPEDAVAAVGAGLVGPAQPVLLAGAPGWDRTADVIGDAWRRRERSFSRILEAESNVMTADEPRHGRRVVADYPGPPGAEPVVAAYRGVAGVTASSSRGWVEILGSVQAEAAPDAVLDGDTSTSWRPAPYVGPEGEWVRVDLARAQPVGRVELLQPVERADLELVTEWRVSAGGVTRTVETDETTGRAVADLDGVRARSVRVEVAATPHAESGIGLAEVWIEGVHPERTLVLPEVPQAGTPDVVLGARPETRACITTLLGPDCAAARRRGSEEAAGIDRTFTVGAAGRWGVRGLAVARATPSTTELLLPFGGPQVRATSVLSDDPAVGPRMAHDGDDTTIWLADGRDPAPTLTIDLGRQRVLRGLDVTPPAGFGAMPDRAVVEADGRRREVDLAGSGSFEPLRARLLTVTFLRDAPDARPTGIAELRLRGGRLTTPFDGAAQAGTPCGFGPPLVVDGRRYQTRVRGDAGSVVSAGQLALRVCGSRAERRLRLAPGVHRVRLLSTPQFQPVGLTLLGLDGDHTRVVERSRSLRLLDADATRVRLDLGPGEEAVLSTPHNHNAGWVATVDGRELEPVTVDGWAQGWLVPADAAGEVELRFTPQRSYLVGLVGGLLLLAGVLLWALWLLVRGRRRGAPPDDRPDPAPPPTVQRADGGRRTVATTAALAAAAAGGRLAGRRAARGGGRGGRGRPGPPAGPRPGTGGRRPPGRPRPLGRGADPCRHTAVGHRRPGDRHGVRARGGRSTPRRPGRHHRRVVVTGRGDDLRDLGWSALVAAVVLGPLFLGPGFWLVGDMVFVPEQPWKAAWLGLDPALPRAVPMDALVSLATQVVPGTWVQRALLLAGLLLGGLGVGRLTRPLPLVARAAAITLLLWNPWVHERLLIGQWAILLGYLALPWVALAARRLREDPRSGWAPAAIACTAAAVCSPSSGVMAAATLAVLGLGRDRSGWWRACGVVLLANLPWLVPSMTATTVRVSADGVFAGFAARAESGAGLLPSLLSLGGIWKTSILPPERTSTPVVLLACLLTLAAVAGLRRATRDHRGELPRLVLLGAGALLVAAAPAVPGAADALETLAARLPGLALLRDSHRFLAPLGVALAVGLAGSVTVVRERVRPGREALWGVAGLLVLAPALLLPSLAWGAAGELQRSSYPAEWDTVAAILEDQRGSGPSGSMVVLPWQGSYRGFDWNHHRAVLDPAPRFFPGTVLTDDRLLLDDVVVPAEDPRAEDVRRALAAADPGEQMRAVGVRWVLVQHGMSVVDPPAGLVRHDGEGLTLVDLAPDGEPVVDPPVAEMWRVVCVSAGHLAGMALPLAAFLWRIRSGRDARHIS